MVNFRIIIKIMGSLLFIEALFLFISAIVSLIYGEKAFYSLLAASALTSAVAFASWFFNRKAPTTIKKRESYLIVGLVWVVFSVFGALPFIIDGSIPSYTDAFFETMSGFTTTGASILNDIEAMPKGLLFWRSITQWIGGMGMILMSLAIMPLLGIGGMELFIAEVPGTSISSDKMHPRVSAIAKRLWGIYIIFTTLQVILMMFGGMSLFDSVNHAFTTMATGGYSTKQSSLIDTSPYIQYVVIVFMIIAGANFSLAYFAFKLKFNRVFSDEELRTYLSIIIVFVLLTTLLLTVNSTYSSIEESFRNALFQVVSIITTTGFVTADYLSWGYIGIGLIFILMFIGGCAGSTGGGIKIVRVMLIIKNSYLEFKRLLHPNAIIPVRLNRRAVDRNAMSNILAFVIFYLMIFSVSSIVMTSMGLDLDSAMGSVIACLGTIGPGIGTVGPMFNFAHIPDAGKWLLSFLMLLGRLELFTIMIIFTPVFWKR
jgi:trk system potassium uptake protein